MIAARHPETAGFHEVYLRAAVATCERRDPKGLYARTPAGPIPAFTGISAPPRPPDAPDLIIDTSATGVPIWPGGSLAPERTIKCRAAALKGLLSDSPASGG